MFFPGNFFWALGLEPASIPGEFSEPRGFPGAFLYAISFGLFVFVYLKYELKCVDLNLRVNGSKAPVLSSENASWIE